MTDRLTPEMLRDFVQLLDRCTNRYQFNAAKEFIREEAARREAEQKPYVAQARLRDEPPGPRTGPSKEGAGVARFLYPIDDGEREGPGSAAAPSYACGYPTCGCEIPCPLAGSKDKPTPAADDLVTFLRGRYQQHCTLAADRIEALTATLNGTQAIYRERDRAANDALFKLSAAEARVRELERSENIFYEAAGKAAVRAEQLEDMHEKTARAYDAEKARADQLAAAIDKINVFARAYGRNLHEIVEEIRQTIDALASEGGKTNG